MRHAALILIALLGASAAAATQGAAAPEAAVTDCDRLAANPEDPDRLLPGLTRAQMDLPAAIAACEAEISRQPSQLRLRYQLARSLFYSGQNERAATEMRAAADGGYRQAQFVYGAMISNGRDKAPSDICITERYWLLSARAGRQAARISYVRHVLKGRFSTCRVQASPQEMRGLLASAAAEAHDYYERLLVEDLIERFDSVGLTSRPSQARP